MSDQTIGEVAELLGVSTRTLRHWDDIGLLQPSFRTYSDYRLYTEEDVDLAWEILVYRETGMPLKRIAEIVHDQASRSEHLRVQRAYLTDQIARLRRMEDAVSQLLEQEMTMSEKAELFGTDWAKYRAEAQERWGDTPEWAQSQQAVAKMSKDDFAAVKADNEAFLAALSDAQAAGVAPGSAEAKELVFRHRKQINQWYDCTPAKQVCLARMYVADERFASFFQGNAPYLLTLIEAQAEAEGVDLATVEWG